MSVSIFIGVVDLNKHLCFERCAGVRPVPLDIHVQGFDISNFESRMQARFLLVTHSALTQHKHRREAW